MSEELEKLKREIEAEEMRSHVRQRSESDTKEYDYRRGLRYAIRKIDEIEKGEEEERSNEEDKRA